MGDPSVPINSAPLAPDRAGAASPRELAGEHQGVVAAAHAAVEPGQPDPREGAAHVRAGQADLDLRPRPGGDIALALGVARLLFERGHADPDAASYCDHLDKFRALEEYALTGSEREIDEETRERMRGLGYVGHEK